MSNKNKVILNLVNKFNLKIINSSEIQLLSDKNKPKIENIIR